MAEAAGSKLVQARISESDAGQLEGDIVALGLKSSSEAVRLALRLLHVHAREAQAAKEMAEFYGDREAPLHPVTAAVYREPE